MEFAKGVILAAVLISLTLDESVSGSSRSSQRRQRKERNKKETILTTKDRLRAKRLKTVVPTEKQIKILENSGLLQGDLDKLSHHKLQQMVLEEEEEDRVLKDDILGLIREGIVPAETAVRDRRRLWNRSIPYTISTRYNHKDRAAIAKAFQEFEDKTCIRFIPKDSGNLEENYLYITPLSGCYSSLGQIPKDEKPYGEPGPQTVSLHQECLKIHGVVLHELMHAIGFFHEQSRFDRDRYVKIIEKNVDEAEMINFKKYNLSRMRHLGVPYDYSSVMHYDSSAFSKNGKKTIVKKKNRRKPPIIGQRRKLSRLDVKKINKLYDCEARPCIDKLPPGTCEQLWRENYCKFRVYKGFTKDNCWKTCWNCGIKKKHG